MDVGKKIKEKRIAAGMPQKVLAQKIGCNQPLVCKWENGTRTPSISQVKKIEKVLGLGVLSEDFVKETLSK